MNSSFKQAISTPIGLLEVTANGKGLTAVTFVDQISLDVEGNQYTQEAVQQLTDYFEGKRVDFSLTLDAQLTFSSAYGKLY